MQRKCSANKSETSLGPTEVQVPDGIWHDRRTGGPPLHVENAPKNQKVSCVASKRQKDGREEKGTLLSISENWRPSFFSTFLL